MEKQEQKNSMADWFRNVDLGEVLMTKGLAVVVALIGGAAALLFSAGAVSLIWEVLTGGGFGYVIGAMFVSGMALFVLGAVSVGVYKLWTMDLYE